MNSTVWKDLKGEIGPHLKTRLDSIISQNKYFVFEEGHRPEGFDIEYAGWGDYENERIYLSLKVGDELFFAAINSPVAHPPMVDRVFGADIADSTMMNWLSDMLYRVYIDGETESEVLDIWDGDFEKRNIFC